LDTDASAALHVLAVAPQALGGVRVRSRAGPERDAWLAALRGALKPSMAWHTLPLHTGDEALLGGLDLTATLAAGRPVTQRGLLARAQGGVLVAAMAERIAAGTAARVCAALDAAQAADRLALIALDEGIDDDEAPPPALLDRLALVVAPERAALQVDAAAVASARAAWCDVHTAPEVVQALVATACALGVASARADWQALCAARIVAALRAHAHVEADDAALAARLVLAPRATRLPPGEAAPPAPQDLPPHEDTSQRQDDDDEDRADKDHDKDRLLDDRLVAAAQAAIPPGLLALLAAGRAPTARGGDAGRAGELARSRQRGRVVGALRGTPRGGARLALIETLRAAAPWQALRRVQAAPRDSTRVHVTTDDLRVQRRVQRRATTTIFAIDASGSQALHRLAEAKGAVELLLADCYARRDRVAVIGFRGAGAQVLLAPTRSLVRAKRQLAGLPGGGGTPLAAGIDAAHALALASRRAGASPLVVMLTDGKANVGRDGTPGREAAQRDALQAARVLRSARAPVLLIDTSPQPSAAATALAAEMGARCVALPHAQAHVLSEAVRRERG
jgi:magnesium chelatase subunit D